MRTTHEKTTVVNSTTSINPNKQKAPIGRWYHKGRFQAPVVCFSANAASHA